MTSNTKWIIGIVGAGIVAAGFVMWIVYFKTPGFTPETTQPQFGVSDTRTTGVTPDTGINTAQPVVESTLSTTKIFKIANGPIAGATLMETTRPTSTIARFVLATSGHSFDYVLDSPGAVPKAISNTTIPGIVRVLWTASTGSPQAGSGRGALFQYVDADTVKTAHLSLPAASATTTSTVRIQFLPAGIASIAVSPDGASVTYLLKTTAGADGYTARADGANAKKIFSLPLSQILISWPSAGTLLAHTPASFGVAGVAFSIDAKTGASAPLLYAEGLTATADRAFSRVVYQTAGATRSTYSHEVKTGLAKPLSFDPIPELCEWSLAALNTLYCAAPLSSVAPNYLDLLHMGASTAASAILSFNLDTGRSTIVALPGSADGGEESDISELAVSASDKYLLFIRKSDRSLWGVRLGASQ